MSWAAAEEPIRAAGATTLTNRDLQARRPRCLLPAEGPTRILSLGRRTSRWARRPSPSTTNLQGRGSSCCATRPSVVRRSWGVCLGGQLAGARVSPRTAASVDLAAAADRDLGGPMGRTKLAGRPTATPVIGGLAEHRCGAGCTGTRTAFHNPAPAGVELLSRRRRADGRRGVSAGGRECLGDPSSTRRPMGRSSRGWYTERRLAGRGRVWTNKLPERRDRVPPARAACPPRRGNLWVALLVYVATAHGLQRDPR